MAKDDYEKLLKRIENNISQQTDSVSRFELPMVDVTWEGKKTILRNFIEFPKALRRDATIIMPVSYTHLTLPTILLV